MNKLLPLVLSLGCAYGTQFGPNSPQGTAEETDIQDKYALIVVGSSDIGNYYGIPQSQNPFYIDGVMIRDRLEQNGFKRENIHFLHGADASYAKLTETADELSRKVDGNDAFVAVISTHGTPFALELEADSQMMRSGQLEDAIEKIRPKVGFLYIDACYSGSIVRDLDLPNYVRVSSTESGTPAYSSTEFSGARNYLKALFDEGSDANKDGRVTFAEAFMASNESAERYQAGLNSQMADMASFEQQMYYGDNASPYENLGPYRGE